MSLKAIIIALTIVAASGVGYCVFMGHQPTSQVSNLQRKCRARTSSSPPLLTRWPIRQQETLLSVLLGPEHLPAHRLSPLLSHPGRPSGS